jgi:hypothetical protein
MRGSTLQLRFLYKGASIQHSRKKSLAILPSRSFHHTFSCTATSEEGCEIQELEYSDPDVKTNWDGSRWFPDNTHPLGYVYAFSSIAQVEFYVKGALLYEEHAVSHFRKRFLHIYWDVEFEELGPDQDNASTSSWVAILTPPPESTRAIRSDILPKEGSAVSLRWMRKENEQSTIDHWMGVLLKAEVGFNQRVCLVVLVWATSPAASAKLLAETYRPAFDFSMEANNLGFILNSMDKLLFLDAKSISDNPPPPKFSTHSWQETTAKIWMSPSAQRYAMPRSIF